MQIIRRAQWGARYADGGGSAPVPASEIWLHHSAGVTPDVAAPFDDDYKAVRDIEAECERRFGQGMSYTFLVTPVGLIFEGHTVGRLGAHTAGHNSAGRAICWVGNYETHGPTGLLIESTAWLLAEGHRQRWWSRHTFTGGHRDVGQTACPGQHAYDALAQINHRADQLWDDEPGQPPPPPSGGPDSIPSMTYGQSSDDVRRLQEFMTRVFAAYNCYIPTGYYGDATAAGLREFQRRTNVDGDGRTVGPQTKRQLWDHGYRP